MVLAASQGIVQEISMDNVSILHILCFFLILIVKISSAADTITTAQSIRDGDTLVSSGESFALGFFNPGSSQNRYLGIWYNKVSVQTVVWVANRKIPLLDPSGVLQVTNQGSLVLLNHNGSIIWSSNFTRAARNPVAQLLDSGNLIIKNEGDDNPENFLWQSFDYPSDTFLPGMKLGRNKVTGLRRYISSSRTPDDPAPGPFSYGVDPDGYPQLNVRENSTKIFRGGPWNGLRFSGTPQLHPNPIYAYGFVLNDKEVYYYYQLKNSSRLSRMMINQNGILQRFTWIERTRSWGLYLTVQIDNCDDYALCGAYGSCNINNSPVCSCLRGFEPKIPKEWETVDWSSGCVRKTMLNCSSDGFVKYSAVKLPETQTSWFNTSMNVEDCKIRCMKNCSCSAYTTLNILTGSGCLLWFGDLIDIREYDENGQDIYIRMAASELDINDDTKSKSNSGAKKQKRIILSSSFTAVILFLGLAMVFYFRKKKLQKDGKVPGFLEGANKKGQGQKEDQELSFFDFDTIACATNNFSIANKLGKGGFGPVFRVMI